jgi:hypothetical protein
MAVAVQFALLQRFLRAKIQKMRSAKPSLAAIQKVISHDEYRLGFIPDLLALVVESETSIRLFTCIQLHTAP